MSLGIDARSQVLSLIGETRARADARVAFVADYPLDCEKTMGRNPDFDEAWCRVLKFGRLSINHFRPYGHATNVDRILPHGSQPRMPDSAFDNPTPNGMYFGRGAAIPDELAEPVKKSRHKVLWVRLRKSCLTRSRCWA